MCLLFLKITDLMRALTYNVTWKSPFRDPAAGHKEICKHPTIPIEIQ